MALLTPVQFRQHFPQLSSTNEDAILTEFIARADALIAAFCGYPIPDSGTRTMGSATYTLHLDSPSWVQPSALCVCVRPIVSVTSVNVDSTWVYGASTLLVLNTDYIVDNDEGLILILPTSVYTWPTAYRATRVVLVAGYATSPPDLVAIGAIVVRHLWNLRNTQGQTSASSFGDSQSLTDFDTLIPEGAKDALRAGYLTACAMAEAA